MRQRLRWGPVLAAAGAAAVLIAPDRLAGAVGDLGVAAAALVIVVIRLRRSEWHRGWFLLVAAFLVWLAGDQGSGLELLSGDRVPLQLAAYPLMAAGVLILACPPTNRSSLAERARLFLLLLGPLGLIATGASGAMESPWDGMLRAGALVPAGAGVGVLMATGIMELRRGSRCLGQAAMASSLLLASGLVTDLFATGAPAMSSWVVATWVASGGFWVCTASRPSSAQVPASLEWLALWGTSVLVVASVFGVGALASGLQNPAQPRLLLGGGAALVAAVVLRLAAFVSDGLAVQREMGELLDRLDEGFVAIDRDGRFLYVNKKLEAMSGRNRAQLLGTLVGDEYPELIQSIAGHKIRQSMTDGRVRTDVAYYPRFDAWWRIDIHPSQEGATLLISDVTESHLAEQRMRLHAAALRATTDMVLITDVHQVVEYANEAFAAITGYAASEVVGKRLYDISSVDAKRAILEHALPEVLEGRPWRGSVLNQRKDGSFYPEELTITPILGEHGECTHLVVMKRDRTEWNRREEQIAALAERDRLTDLANRDAFVRELGEVAPTTTDSTPGAVLVLDIDRFHLLNDTLGHDAGDRLLKDVAALLVHSVRHNDLVSRLGSDQYAVLLRRGSMGDAMALGARLGEKVSRLHLTDGGRVLSPSASVGIAVLDGTLPGTEVLRRADVACNAAKVRGGNRVERYLAEEELMAAALEGEWVARVKAALRSGRITLYYQPIASLRTGEVTHHEVLVRLVEEDGTVVTAGAFMPAVEHHGLVSEIDRVVVRTALARVARERDRGRVLRLTVNLSALSFRDDSMLEFICAQLAELQIDPSHIVFEITETAAIADLDRARRFIETLREVGCRFALDDFGSGLSSFAYLRALPVDFIKIDGSFVKDLDDDLVNQLVVSSINEIAHFLQIPTVAEGVEDPGTLRVLREMGVDFAQGFFLGRPGPDPVDRVLEAASAGLPGAPDVSPGGASAPPASPIDTIPLT